MFARRAGPGPLKPQKEYDIADQKKSTFQRLINGRLNRKQRRELGRKISAEDPGLEIVNRNVAGIDVGNESHFVAVAPGRDPQPVREFGSWTADLERMADWLKACGIETVVMMETAGNRRAPNNPPGGNAMATLIRRRGLLERRCYPRTKTHVGLAVVEMGGPRFQNRFQVAFILLRAQIVMLDNVQRLADDTTDARRIW